MLELFICDDNISILNYLQSVINDNFKVEFNITTLSSVTALMSKIELEHKVPDIIIMDIKLKDGNGIDAIKAIQEIHQNVNVIYCTAFNICATDTFCYTEPSGFITKPIDNNKLIQIIKKTVDKIYRNIDDYIMVKYSGSEVLIKRKDITFIESKGRKIFIHIRDNRYYTINQKIDYIQYKLDEAFIRVHKSFLINMLYVEQRENQIIHLITGDIIPISKNNLKEFKERFDEYIGQK